MKNNLLSLNRYLLLITLVFCFEKGFSQTYCTPSHTGPGTLNSFYTHIKNVTLGDINYDSPAPFFPPSPHYDNLTFISTDLTLTVTYPISIYLGNGANPQTVAVWIDYNQNKTFESTERVLAVFDQMNTGTHIINSTVTIPVNAKLGQTRMRVGTRYGTVFSVPDPCNNNDLSTATFNWSQHFQDYTVNILSQATQVFLSTTTTHPTQDEVAKGSTNNVIIGVEVVTNSNGTLSPLTAGNFNFSSIGTTNPAEISNAKLFYTGLDPVFNTSTQVGSTVTSLSSNFTVNANQKLKTGKNFFWLTFDVSATAILKNVIDARCNSVVVSQVRIPTVVSPAGNREVGYCVSKGNQFWFVNILRFSVGNIFNGIYQNYSGYGDFTWMSTDLARSQSHVLNMRIGNGVNPGFERAWIDYNQDGDFTDAGELIFDSTYNPPGPPTQDTTPAIHTFFVPATAKVGPTRLRLSVQSSGGPQPCTNPVQIGEIEDYTIVITDPGQPVADFSANTVCKGSQTSFTDLSYTFGSYFVNKWNWNFGDPSTLADTSASQFPTYTYSTPGVYNVTLTVNTNLPGSPSTITKAVIVEDPAAAFSYRGSLFQTPISFTDASLGGVAIDWDWDFGDPQSGALNTAKGSTPTHVFDTAGTYQVTLIVTSSGGCKDTIVQNVVIYSTIPPIADFSASTYNPYVSQGVNLVDQSINAPTTWKWTITPVNHAFISGTNLNTVNPVVTLDLLGTFTVTLKVTNAAGSDSISKTFITKNYTKPVADFIGTPLVIKAGQSVAFLDLSANDPNSWLWDFGDTISGSQNLSTQQHPYHQYNNAGSYHVTLTASNSGGANSKTVNNYVSVTSNYNLCDNTITNSPSYTGTIYDSGGPTGNYFDGSNCGFTIKPACSGPITLTFLSFNMFSGDFLKVYDGGDATGIPLFTGNGFTGTTIPPVLTSNSGMFHIVEVTDNSLAAAGFQAYWQASANVKPVVSVSADSVGYINSPVRFTNTTTSGAGNNYYWDFDNNGINDSVSTNAVFAYNTVGIKTIRLVAENCVGSDTIFISVNIKVPTVAPVIAFVASNDTVAPSENVIFTDLSTNGPVTWDWSITPSFFNFVNGTSNTSFMPQVTFYLSGYYDVCLTATNAAGSSTKCMSKYILVKELLITCSAPYQTDVAIGDIYDSGGPTGNYILNSNCGTAITPCAEKVILNFTSFDYAAGDYLRIYDGVDNTGIPLFTGAGFTGNILPGTMEGKSGSLYVEEITDGFGTSGGFAANWYSEKALLPTALFTSKDTAYTGGSITNFDNLSTGKNLIYEWDFENDGTIDQTSRDGEYTYLTQSIKVAKLKVANCLGQDIYTKLIVVLNPTKKPAVAFTADNLRPSTSDLVHFRDTSGQGPNSWSWKFTPNTVTYLNGTFSTSKNPQVRFNAAGLYEVCLRAENAIGADSLCKSSYINVLNYCLPSAGFSNDVGIARVLLRDLNNVTNVAGGYYDFTANYSATLERRSVNTITIERVSNFNNQNLRVWIDYNQDGDFTDAGENVVILGSNNLMSNTTSFTVPVAALLGSTRMRVGAALNNTANTPCGPINIGEYEDYKIFIVNDVTKPVITLKGSNPFPLEAGYTFNDPGAIALDDAEGDISAQIVVTGIVDNKVLGAYQIKYNVSDASGNAATEVVRTVIVTADVTKPVITLTGLNPYPHPVKTPFIDPGANGFDLLDGNITSKLKHFDNVDINKLGSYSSWYHLTDSSGNKADSVIRIVNVVDLTPPVITLKGSNNIKIIQGQPFIDPWVTVTDNYDTGLVATVSSTPVFNYSVVGSYLFTYNAVDKSGNVAASVIRVVEVGSNSLEELFAGGRLEIYPNPAADKIWIKATLRNNTSVGIKVMNVLGEEVISIPPSNIIELNQMIDVSTFASGVYYLRIQTGTEVLTRKITVAK